MILRARLTAVGKFSRRLHFAMTGMSLRYKNKTRQKSPIKHKKEVRIMRLPKCVTSFTFAETNQLARVILPERRQREHTHTVL